MFTPQFTFPSYEVMKNKEHSHEFQLFLYQNYIKFKGNVAPDFVRPFLAMSGREKKPLYTGF